MAHTMKRVYQSVIIFCQAISCLILPVCSQAMTYPLPVPNESLIGMVQHIQTHGQDKRLAIQQDFDVGYNALIAANPLLSLEQMETLPTTPLLLTIPSQHLLPMGPRTENITINLPEMRLYYYLPDTQTILTYPIGIGKIGNVIPITQTVIKKKVKNPIWTPTAQIRAFNLQQGITLPTNMPAGPDNPLGPYALYTGIPTYLIHSTIFPESVGRRASFGCIRVYVEDMADLFEEAAPNTPLFIVNQPVKIGWQNDHLYMEAHPALKEHDREDGATLLPDVVHLIQQATQQTPTIIDWQLVAFIAQKRDGMPHEIGVKVTKG